MKASRIFMAISVAVVAAGCAKEINGNVEKPHTRITVGIEEQTRTIFGEIKDGKRSILWTNGDQIAINGIASKPLENITTPSSTAVFDFEALLDTPYNTLYPAAIYTGATTVALPKSITSQVLPLAGQGLSVKALTSVIRINITKGSHEATLKKIVLSSKGGVQLCGPFTIDYAATTIAGTDPAEANQSIELEASDLLKDNDTLSYYFPVPEGTYGFKVRVIDTKGHYMEKETVSDKTFTKGHILGMTPFEFAPTGTQIDIIVNNAADLIRFAKDYNEGKIEEGELSVQLGADIEFTDAESAEFEATGGIGVDDLNGATNYFNGTFNGNGKFIKGLKSSVPVFAYTGGAGKILNLNIDGSCVFTATTASADFGSIVGRHKGTVQNCTSNATINVSGDAFSAETSIGGIVGRSYEGRTLGCTMTGSILYPSGSSTKSLRFGGIVGCADGDKDTENEGLVSKCTFSGTLKIADDTDFGGPIMKGIYIYAGGIVGLLQDGSIDDCTVNESVSIIAKGQSKTNIGGIAGRVNAPAKFIKGCVNNAPISYASNGARADTTPTYIGGILGENGDDSNTGASIEDCENNGSLTIKINSTTASLGGIAGYSNGNMKDCTNNGDITRSSTTPDGQANRYIAMGGCVGAAGGSGIFSNLNNSAAITCNFPGTSTNTTVALGGIIGKILNAKSATSIAVTGCTNTGKVNNSSNDSNDSSILSKLPSMCTGGVVGYINCGITVSNCINRGDVIYNYNTKQNGRVSTTGGIIGAVRATVDATNKGVADAKIIGCSNFGRLQNTNFNNTYSLAGGAICGCIVGVAIGTSASPVQITECINADDATTSCTYSVKRGYLGGIAGWAEFCNISGCSSSKSTATYSTSMPAYNAGIAASCVSTTITNCNVSNATLHASSSASCTSAGIAATIDAGTVIDGCTVTDILLTYNAATGFTYGGIVGTTVAGSTIKNSKFKGGWSSDAGKTSTPMTLANIAADTNFTDGGGNTLLD